LASEAAGHSIRHARLAGNAWLAEANGMSLALDSLYGPSPVPEAIARCEALLADGLRDRHIECGILCTLAQLKAMNGELAAARDLLWRARATLRDLGRGRFVAATGLDLLRVELHGGDLEAAEREARADLEYLQRIGDSYALSTLAAMMARVVRDQGRDDDALTLTRIAEAASADDDIESQVCWRAVRAPIVARAGDLAAAEALARAAAELALATEAPMLQADAHAELAAVLHLAARPHDARAALAAALGSYEAKGNVVAAMRWRQWGEQLAAG
jgi:ATP/maltotriose-dependent transcriptional regulator MalT